MNCDGVWRGFRAALSSRDGSVSVKIWHVGASSSPVRVDGVSRTVWLLSKEQARLGHDVTLILDETPDQAARDIARESGLKLIDIDASYVQYPGEIRKIID